MPFNDETRRRLHEVSERAMQTFERIRGVQPGPSWECPECGWTNLGLRITCRNCKRKRECVHCGYPEKHHAGPQKTCPEATHFAAPNPFPEALPCEFCEKAFPLAELYSIPSGGWACGPCADEDLAEERRRLASPPICLSCGVLMSYRDDFCSPACAESFLANP